MTTSSKTLSINSALAKVPLIEFEQSGDLPCLDNNEFMQQIELLWLDHHQPLANLLEPLMAKIHIAHTLSPKSINACIFVDMLFDVLAQSKAIDNALFNEFCSTKLAFLKTAIQEPSFFESNQHTLRLTSNQLLTTCAGWEFGLCNDNLEYWQLCQSTIKALVQINSPNKQIDEDANLHVRSLLNHHKIFTSMQNQLHQQQIKHHHSLATQRFVEDYLDQITEGKIFQPIIANFLKHPWRMTLVYHRSKETFTEALWESLCAFTADMCTLFDLNSKSKSDLVIASIRPNLSKFLPDKQTNKDKTIAGVINAINATGSPSKGEKIEPFLEKNQFKHLNFSSSIIKTIASLPLGQWVSFSSGEFAGQKLQLVEKITDSREALLVNLTGSKFAFMSFQGLAYRITSQKAELINSTDCFEQAFSEATRMYLERFEAGKIIKVAKDRDQIKGLTAQLQNAEQQIAALNKTNSQLKSDAAEEKTILLTKIQALEAQLTETENNKRELEKRVVELTQERTELKIQFLQKLEKLSQNKMEYERSNKAQLSSLEEEKLKLAQQLEQINHQNRRYEAIQQVKSLTIGSWLKIKDEEGQALQRKIAMIYSSSGKYVLTDNKGIMAGEYLADQLVEMVINNNASILQQASNFDDSMESIIKSLK